jgi:3-hydroxyacyl-[acyl-carrier-protein] dehydratase
MRFLLVDRIVEWKPGDSIQGIKNVAMSEDFLEFHFPGKPVMPGALLLEALAQLAGWLEAVSSDFRDWLLLRTVRKCMFYGFVLPGDRVELHVQKTVQPDGQVSGYIGVCLVEQKKKIVAEFDGDLIPFAELENIEEQKKFFDLLARRSQADR